MLWTALIVSGRDESASQTLRTVKTVSVVAPGFSEATSALTLTPLSTVWPSRVTCMSALRTNANLLRCSRHWSSSPELPPPTGSLLQDNMGTIASAARAMSQRCELGDRRLVFMDVLPARAVGPLLWRTNVADPSLARTCAPITYEAKRV